MEVKAVAKDIGVSPRKVRLLLREMPGKGVDEALALLRYAPQPIAREIAKVVRSAAANAENNYALDRRGLRIRAAYAGQATRLRRSRARSRGRMGVIFHQRSHITVVVEGE